MKMRRILKMCLSERFLATSLTYCHLFNYHVYINVFNYCHIYMITINPHFNIMHVDTPIRD